MLSPQAVPQFMCQGDDGIIDGSVLAVIQKGDKARVLSPTTQCTYGCQTSSSIMKVPKNMPLVLADQLQCLTYKYVNMYAKQNSLKSYWSKISRYLLLFSVQFSYLKEAQEPNITWILDSLKWMSARSPVNTFSL